jgi:hypothetical protein
MSTSSREHCSRAAAMWANRRLGCTAFTEKYFFLETLAGADYFLDKVHASLVAVAHCNSI